MSLGSGLVNLIDITNAYGIIANGGIKIKPNFVQSIYNKEGMQIFKSTKKNCDDCFVKKLDKNIKCFCVGNATENKARSVGFQNTIAAEGNVTNLKELIIQSYESKNKELLYVSGETISVDLDQQLLSEGFKVKRIINYRVDHNQKFDEKFVNELKLNMPDMVYVYSQNSASSFLNFIKIYQTENLWMNTNLMCIGEKTSSILNEIKWKKIFLFNPGEEEFLLYKI